MYIYIYIVVQQVLLLLLWRQETEGAECTMAMGTVVVISSNLSYLIIQGPLSLSALEWGGAKEKWKIVL